ncbi:GTPase [Campylobacter sp. MG1]|uniref:GTPase n=1 Tax=Campylobacter sp. MG1 TaxID=2976332 RepID=UPI00226CF17F|nr:GTPase [Campylobacter sp. MG1]
MSIEQIIAEEKAKFEKANSYANIMILGHTGAGKSSLINHVFGSKVANVSNHKPQTGEFNVFLGKDFNKTINIIDSEGYELAGEADSFVNKVKDFQNKLESGKINNCEGNIHVIWYCISASKTRVEDMDLNIVKLLKKNYKNIFVVMTQCDEDDANLSIQKEYEKILNTKIYAVSKDLADEDTDLNSLLNDSANSISDDDIQKAFVASQERSIALKEQHAKTIILRYTSFCVAAGANPIPLVSDTVVITPTQVAMLVHIGRIYGVDISKTALKSLAAETLASNLGKALAGNLLKFTGVGAIVGSAITASVAGVITYGMGFAYSEYCKKKYQDILAGKVVDDDIVENICQVIKHYIDTISWADVKKELHKNKENKKDTKEDNQEKEDKE